MEKRRCFEVCSCTGVFGRDIPSGASSPPDRRDVKVAPSAAVSGDSKSDEEGFRGVCSLVLCGDGSANSVAKKLCRRALVPPFVPPRLRNVGMRVTGMLTPGRAAY